jgi:hypothetical protein
MEGLFTSSEKELLIRALRALAFFVIAVLLARNVTQVALPIFQLSFFGFDVMFQADAYNGSSDYCYFAAASIVSKPVYSCNN